MARRNAALSATGVVVLAAAAFLLLVTLRTERSAVADTSVNVSANVTPTMEHYDQGQIDWAFSSAGGFRSLRLTGKMDVTFGPLYVSVKTPLGVTVFLRENLRYAGPLTQTPEFGNQ